MGKVCGGEELRRTNGARTRRTDGGGCVCMYRARGGGCDRFEREREYSGYRGAREKWERGWDWGEEGDGGGSDVTSDECGTADRGGQTQTDTDGHR